MKQLVKKFLLAVGSIAALILHSRNVSEIFFFFPFYHVGGAENVHANILATVADKKPWIIISGRSTSTALKKRFEATGRVMDISSLLWFTVFWIIFIGYFARLVNSCKKPLVFGCNSYFYYELLPYLQSHVYCVDLLHAFGGGIEDFCLPQVPRLDRRIVIDRNTYENMKTQYFLSGFDTKLLERIDIVENKVAIPEKRPRKDFTGTLQIYYVGRGSEEKRVHLVGKIASLCHQSGLAVSFTLVGDVVSAVQSEDRPHCFFTGEIHDSAQVNALYDKAGLLLITSSREGFPMAVMEGMAHGAVPIATNVGGLSYHVTNGENGFLIEDNLDEEVVVAGFTKIIKRLEADRPLLARMSETTYDYAARNFGPERFDEYYCKLFSKLNKGDIG